MRWTVLAAIVSVAACAPGSLVDVKPPNGIIEPSAVATPGGARQIYNKAQTTFAMMFGGMDPCCSSVESYAIQTAVFTDELMRVERPSTFDKFPYVTVDERSVVSADFGVHRARAQLRQARDAIRAYWPDGPRALQGQLYALEGVTVLWFAEAYCSGVPLTTVSLAGIPTFTAGLNTTQLFQQAIAYFDSAIVLGADSTRFVNLARVGKGRALLGMGDFANAALAVKDVPTDFVYRITNFSQTINPNFIGKNPSYSFQVVDNEGTNGLVWSTDPRTGITTMPALTGAMKVPAKYSLTTSGILDPSIDGSSVPMRLADGLEARLIEAEAALSAGNASWLTILNQLRSTCIETHPCAPVPGLTAGSLPPLANPATPSARVDTLMSERAKWLYLTGHRQGDLRRLARHYQRAPDTLWPIGTYQNPGFPPNVPVASTHGTTYGSEVVFRIGGDEATNNPLYQGCINVEP